MEKGEDRPLSDVPLMWMLREAQKAGMPLDPDKVRASNLFPDEPEPEPENEGPRLQVEGQPLPERPQAQETFEGPGWTEEIHRIATTSRVHDSLRFGGGLGWGAVAAWKFMECELLFSLEDEKEQLTDSSNRAAIPPHGSSRRW